MLIIGASGHAKVIIECLSSQSIPINGVFDDDLNKEMLLSYKILGPYNDNYLKEDSLIIAIGDNEIRKQVAGRVRHNFGVAIHKSSLISHLTKLGEGTVIMHNTVVQADTQIGKHCIINTSSSVDHDCTLGDFVHIGPNAVLCGGIKIGDGSLIGAGSTIIPNISIGKNVIIGAGSIITHDIPDNSRVYPAKSIIYEGK